MTPWPTGRSPTSARSSGRPTWPQSPERQARLRLGREVAKIINLDKKWHLYSLKDYGITGGPRAYQARAKPAGGFSGQPGKLGGSKRQPGRATVAKSRLTVGSIPFWAQATVIMMHTSQQTRRHCSYVRLLFVFRSSFDRLLIVFCSSNLENNSKLVQFCTLYLFCVQIIDEVCSFV